MSLSNPAVSRSTKSLYLISNNQYLVSLASFDEIDIFAVKSFLEIAA